MEVLDPKIRNFRDLEVWKLGKQIVYEIYAVTKSFPDDERFGLVTQMRRAAVSIPANISEGFNRFHNKEYKQFLYIALGSCAELETHVEVSFDLTFLDLNSKNKILELLNHESRMLRNLIKKL